MTSYSIAANSYNAATLARGSGAAASTPINVATVSSGTWVSIGFWATRAVEPFTFAGSVSFNLWGLENNTQANAGLGLRIYSFTAAGGLGSQIIQISSSTELTGSAAAYSASGTPSSTSIASNAILVFEVGAVNIGTMGSGSGRTVDFFYDASSAAAQGDSYVTFTENIVLRNRKKVFG